MTDSRKIVNSKEIIENENPIKVINIVEKFLDLNKQENGRGRPSKLETRLKILTPEQTFERLPIALAQAKLGNIS